MSEYEKFFSDHVPVIIDPSSSVSSRIIRDSAVDSIRRTIKNDKCMNVDGNSDIFSLACMAWDAV